MTKVHVLLTGSPGVGKTTLVKNAIEVLQKDVHTVRGFYTEEVRHHGTRIGFDVVTLDGTRASMARVCSEGTTTAANFKGPRVGKYCVDVQSFEDASLPTLKPPVAPKTVFAIDEIGKMEMFSKEFQQAVVEIFDSPNCVILATVPLCKGKPLPLVNELLSRKDICLLTVTKESRNNLLSDIITRIKLSLA